MTLEESRRSYADALGRAAHHRSKPLVEAFARVPREKFLGPPPWHIGSDAPGFGYGGGQTDNPQHLYQDVLVALDPARGLNNGQPSALAEWIGALNLQAGDRVFHLGCGPGYYTAVMAEVVGEEGRIMAAEIDSDLAGRAKQNLAGYTNVMVYAGDGAELDSGACDAMLINAGVTHPHPRWLARLNEGGRLVLPLTVPAGTNQGNGVMARIAREQGKFAAEIISSVAIYDCATVRNAALEPRLERLLTTNKISEWKSVRVDSHDETETCLLHDADFCFSRLPVTSTLVGRV